MSHQAPSRRRRLIFQAIVLLACLALLELGSLVALRSMSGRWLTKRVFLAELGATDEGSAPAEISADHFAPRWMLHPYLGFARNPEAPRHGLRGKPVSTPVNDHGFFGPSAVAGSPDAFRVALTGGSVALELYLGSAAVLTAELEKLPAAAGKSVELVSLALGGMKQPQQVLALNYFLSVGAVFDMVINLDGFNEVTLPIKENLLRGVHPFFPRNWVDYSATSVEIGAAALYGRLAERNAERARRRERLATSLWRRSYLGLALWELGRRRLDRQIVELEEELRTQQGDQTLSPHQRGPAYDQKDTPRVLRDCVLVWRESSRQMSRVSDALGITYFHFLQPNQYVADSKEFTAFERRSSVNLNAAYSRFAVLGYPKLIAAGRGLADAGEPFYDLTGIFKDVEETVYDDTCCHLNQLGYDLLAAAIGGRIAGDPRMSGT